MRKVALFLLIALALSCGRHQIEPGKKIITVSIAPFQYFVEAIGGENFTVNVMVPPGADPHVYEPYPDQVMNLGKSAGYISNGYLGFEKTWLRRFYETNNTMKRLSLGDSIKPITSNQGHNDTGEGVDPHFWVSLRSGLVIASAVKDFLTGLDTVNRDLYKANYDSLCRRISALDKEAVQLFSSVSNRSFMIFHPNLTYLARDYGLDQVPVEYEGKEPSPSRMKYLIDMAVKKNIKVIFVQREFDDKAVKTIARQTGATLVTIDPLSEDWLKSTGDIIKEVYSSLEESAKKH